MMTLAIAYALEMMRVRYPNSAGSVEISSRMIIMVAVWVCVFSVEVVLYWRIRKRNVYRRESWAHVILLISAFVLPYLGNVLILYMGEALKIRDINKMRSFYYVAQGLYWLMIVLAHVFFVQVLVKCFSKSSFVEEGNGDNVLDDIEN